MNNNQMYYLVVDSQGRFPYFMSQGIKGFENEYPKDKWVYVANNRPSQADQCKDLAIGKMDKFNSLAQKAGLDVRFKVVKMSGAEWLKAFLSSADMIITQN